MKGVGIWVGSSLCFLLSIQIISAKHSSGKLWTHDNWHFVDRFCFISEKGQLRYEFRYPAKYAVEKVYLYYDSAGQWPAVYKSGKTCMEKESVLRLENYQIMNLTAPSIGDYQEDYTHAGCENMHINNEEWIVCRGIRKFSSYRERWWYIAAGNCNSTQGLYLEYSLNMTNGREDNIWYYQFSADQFDILPTDIGFLFTELLALVISIAIAVILRSKQMLHTTYKLFMISLVMEVLSLFLDCVAYGKYAQNGVGLPLVKYLGEVCRAGSRLVFLLVVILMAKGFTITRGRLSRSGAWKITFFMTVYTLVYLSMLFYQVRVFDPAEVLYLYDSPMGYGLLVMRVVGWVWFCYAIYFTLVHYPEKRGFYYRFSVIFSFWFWLGPVTILLSNHILPNYMREKIVNGVDNGVSLLGFIAFIFITRPGNSNFPYHVRTTQIEAVNAADDDEEKSTHLPHHTYEMKARKMDDIFTVGDARNGSFLGQRHPNNRHKTPEPFPDKMGRPASPDSEPLTQNDTPPSYEDIVAQDYANTHGPTTA